MKDVDKNFLKWYQENQYIDELTPYQAAKLAWEESKIKKEREFSDFIAGVLA